MPPGPINMEVAFWNVVVEMDTPAAYQAYLDRYPNGQFRNIARAAITGAALDAEAQAQAAEAALGLDRTDRRNIQRNLSLLGYNPRGIDGIFGPGSRAAIKAWQRANGYDPTGYLTAQQVRAMASAAKTKADQLAAEAAARKAEEERRDTQYWRDTGRGASEAGLRSYLDRYPDGLFADVAEARLAEIEATKRAQAEAAERAFWDDVRARDTAADYQRYLDRFPKGLFAHEARARIKELTAGDTAEVIAAAKAEEARVVSNGVLRLLGDPDTRYREDPVRMLRAVRFATKLGFRIEPETERPITTLASLLGDIPPARLFDEMLKLFMSGSALANFEMLRHYDLFRQLFPLTDESLTHQEHDFPLTFISHGMANTDERVQADKPVTPAFLFAVFLWEPVRQRAARLEADGQAPAQALQHAGSQIITEQAGVMATPRRFSLPMREIWMLQLRLERKGGRRSLRVLGHPQFRAAYDFLLLRGKAGEVTQELCDWWTEFQAMHPEAREKAVTKTGPRRRRRRPRRKANVGGKQV